MNCKWHRMLRKSSPLTSVGYLALHQDGFAFEWHIEMPVLSSGIDFYFFLSCLPSSHSCLLHDCLLTSLFQEALDLQRSRISPYPEPSQGPWGQCKAKPRRIGFDSWRSLLTWPRCSEDFYCFLIRREHKVIELFPEIWEAESAVKSFNTARNCLFCGFYC